ncbi:DUF397 domain-containing protein [Streptomyces sp. H27-D2]|uniref:DUF397 domain-containing protein n=1 Tax=Streptomyces sp. H27-D2 TaxID=3046304 RepID=UPI002DBC7E06|nr:DUF397 domain-containing protein [Streptomyces sp. H27-D2]MEC4014766.1 DUF397 domain-containing protein [Streptomyces sp. H27-D2]
MSEIQWQKSSYSADAEGNNCVELALSADAVLLRESDDPSVVAAASSAQLGAFIHRVKAGAFDHLTR